MRTNVSRRELLDAFELLARVERAGEGRDLVALAGRVDGWVAFSEPPPAGIPAQGAFRLQNGVEGAAWLLPGGMVAAGSPPRVESITEGLVTPAVLAHALRRGALESYLGDAILEDQAPAALQGVIADLIALAWESDSAARATIYTMLFESMRPGEGWNMAGARLKAGFERGLNDRSAEVRRTSAAALVAMATGTGPRPPTEEPWRILYVLFAVPERDVHVATLRALGELPEDKLRALSEPLEDLLKDAVAADDSEERRLAADLRLRLHGAPEMGLLAADIESADRTARLRGLARLGHDPEAVEELLPHVLSAASDPDPEIRAAAVAALRPLVEADPVVRRRILREFLASGSEDTIEVALGIMNTADLSSDSVRSGLQEALVRSGRHQAAVVELLARHYREAGISAAADGLTGLLMSGDPEIRLAAIHHLAGAPPERPGLRDLLITPLSDQLRHPDPRVRIAASEALVAIGYPQAPQIVSALAYDIDSDVRRSAVVVVERAGTYADAAGTASIARDVGVLMAPREATTGDARLQWVAALGRLAGNPSPHATEVLAAALAAVPAADADPFLAEAETGLIDAILARTDAADLPMVCRHMLERGGSGGEHAARLAGSAAATNPAAMDFLWTLYAASDGPRAEAARRELAALAGTHLDAAVRAELETALAHTTDAARRDVLSTLLAR